MLFPSVLGTNPKLIIAGIAVIIFGVVSFGFGFSSAKNIYKRELLEYENAVVKQNMENVSKSAEISRKQSEAALYALQTVEKNLSDRSSKTIVRKVIETKYEQIPVVDSEYLPTYWVQLYNASISKGTTEVSDPTDPNATSRAIKAITAIELINDNNDRCIDAYDKLDALQQYINKVGNVNQ